MLNTLPDGYITAREAARRTGYHPTYTYILTKRGKLESIKIGRNRYIAEKDLKPKKRHYGKQKRIRVVDTIPEGFINLYDTKLTYQTVCRWNRLEKSIVDIRRKRGETGNAGLYLRESDIERIEAEKRMKKEKQRLKEHGDYFKAQELAKHIGNRIYHWIQKGDVDSIIDGCLYALKEEVMARAKNTDVEGLIKTLFESS